MARSPSNSSFPATERDDPTHTPPRPAAGGGLAGEMQAHAQRAGAFLGLLANPHRLMILCHLLEGECTVGELVRRLPLSQPAVSQHLALLRDSGLVTTRRQGQTIHCALASEPAREVLDVLHRHFCTT